MRAQAEVSAVLTKRNRADVVAQVMRDVQVLHLDIEQTINAHVQIVHLVILSEVVGAKVGKHAVILVVSNQQT